MFSTQKTDTQLANQAVTRLFAPRSQLVPINSALAGPQPSAKILARPMVIGSIPTRPMPVDLMASDSMAAGRMAAPPTTEGPLPFGFEGYGRRRDTPFTLVQSRRVTHGMSDLREEGSADERDPAGTRCRREEVERERRARILQEEAESSDNKEAKDGNYVQYWS